MSLKEKASACINLLPDHLTWGFQSSQSRSHGFIGNGRGECHGEEEERQKGEEIIQGKTRGLEKPLKPVGILSISDHISSLAAESKVRTMTGLGCNHSNGIGVQFSVLYWCCDLGLIFCLPQFPCLKSGDNNSISWANEG